MQNWFIIRLERKYVYGFSDSTWAEDTNDRKSRSGFCFIFAGGPISRESKKQSLIVLSSAETEYIAVNEAVKESFSIQHILEELGFSIQHPIKIMVDNQSAIKIAESEINSSRTKHIHL